jgi:alkanesulfonate monooxygenase SsuD/methylene tetrahydromethanopterin reductase-like flavin-dependent oxidoreductase (luciferase family)
MRFFLYVNPQTPGAAQDGRVLDEMTRHVLYADTHGFEAMCITEHHFTDYNTFGNAFMYAAYLAPQLKNATIILTATVPALHNPMALAQQANLLDQLTHGKTIIGFASGGSPTEFKGLGRDPAKRRDLMLEVIDVVRQAWAKRPEDPPLGYRTEHDHGVLTHRIMPAPYEKTEPRIGRASTSDEGMVWAAEQGMPWFFGRYMPADAKRVLDTYAEKLGAAGHSQQRIEYCLEWTLFQKLVYVAPTDEEAYAEIETPLKLYGDIFKVAYPAESPKDMSLDSGSVQPKMGVRAIDRDEFVRRAMVVGSPQTVRKVLQEYADAGVRSFTGAFYFGDMSRDRLDRSMRLFVDEVMPHFR